VIAQRTLVLALLSSVIAACGGGGGGGGDAPPTTNPPPVGGPPNNPPPPPTQLPEPADWEQYGAENAQLRMFSIETLLSITWIDLLENEQGFRVERRIGEAGWEVVETLPAMSGGLGYWGRQVPEAARYRLTAMLDGRSIPLHSPGHETEFAIDPAPANPPIIQLDQSEPVRGAARVSVLNAEPAAAVSYALAGGMFARVTGGGTFPATLPAQRLLDGARQLQVYIEKSPGLTISRIRFLQVDNPLPAVAFYVTAEAPPIIDGGLSLVAQASSDAGISAVEFFINGASVHVAHAPVPGTHLYDFPVDRATLPPGENLFRVVATDSTNATVAMERTYPVDAPPTLNVIGLTNGMIASGNALRISGTFSDDTTGSNLRIDVDNRLVLRTLNSPFGVDFPLTGVPPGQHSVYFRVQDSSGKVTSRYYTFVVPSTT
jgi:hypothetical protein